MRGANNMSKREFKDSFTDKKNLSILSCFNLIQNYSTEFLKSIENMVNPYDKDFTAKTIKDVLRDFQLDGKLKKEFFDFSL